MDWQEAAVQSETEYSKALKSVPVDYANFTHLYNPYVPWAGDFNRAVAVKAPDFKSFAKVMGEVRKLHRDKALEPPNRFDIYPPAVEERLWHEVNDQSDLRLTKAVFFLALATRTDLPAGFRLKVPSQEEYMDWFSSLVKSRGYYDEAWFQQVKPLQLHFAGIFRPYWLLKGEDLAGWVYCANLGEYARLFEVEISPKFQGKGLGKLLLQAIRNRAYNLDIKYILLQSGEKLRGFYEKAGFQECATNSIVWVR